MEYANKNKDALSLSFHVPDFYFPFYLSRCHYGFAIYMYRMKELPEDASELFQDYKILRKLAFIALCSHVFLGAEIAFLMIYHHISSNT